MRDLELEDYLMEPQCDVLTSPYTPVNAEGWNIGSGMSSSIVIMSKLKVT